MIMENIAPDTIELLVCKKIEQAKCRPMSEDVTRILMKLLFNKDAIVIPEKEKPFLYLLIEKRVKHCFTYTLSNSLILFLAILSEKPGVAVMYLWYLQYQAKKNGITEFTLRNFCEIFPWGFPDEEIMSEIWNGQKFNAEHDNLVDHASAGQSLMF
jgi:hypothetical protein